MWLKNLFSYIERETCSGGQCERRIMCIYICMYIPFLVHMYSEQTGQASRDRL